MNELLNKFPINAKVIRLIEKKILSNKLNKALVKIQKSVLDVITNPVYTAKVLDSPELDHLCERIGHKSLDQLFQNKAITIGNPEDTVVFIASRLQSSGGHSRVLEDFVKHLPHQKKYVIVTEVPGHSNRNTLKRRLADLGAEVEWAKRGNLLTKLQWLQIRINKLCPKDIYLFNHHEDSVAISAVATTSAQVHFYHHGDHHLSLGIHIPQARHIDIHAFGYNNCKNNLKVENNCYLPLISKDCGPRNPEIPFMIDGMLTTCTAAGKNKIEIEHPVSYVDVIPLLLSATRGRHIHIGKLSYFARRKIFISLKKLNITPESFVYIPFVPSVWQALHQFHVDLYLSSFPVTGGRTLVEVMGAGIPIVIHDHPTSRFLSGVDMVYKEAFTWRWSNELYEYCASIQTDELSRQSYLARKHYTTYYSDKLLSEGLQNPQKCKIPPLHPLRTIIDTNLVQKQTINEHNISKKIFRLMYRNAKYFRSIFSNLLN